MGSVQYISPEIVMGEAAGPRSDLYSLGVIIYEMLTGCRPFEAAEAESPLAVAMRHVT
ncbi:MAG TPA: protein kinase [Rubrobacteraceae bacterium]|nr:protein kinase [Rubrobacteraceae bacterium]